MSLFEFVITLFSIVIALGIARVLSGFVGLIEFRASIQHKPLLCFWLIHLLLAQIVWWFSIWGQSGAETIRLGQTLLFFFVPACLFISARLLVPGDADMAEMSSRYERLRVPFLVFLAAPGIPGPLLAGFGMGDWTIARYLVPMSIILLAGIPFPNIRVQYVVVITVLLIYMTFAFQYRSEVVL